MADTTTIEITTDQRDELEERKQHDRESFKAVVGRFLGANDPPAKACEQRQASEASELLLDDLREQLDRIESAASTAEARTGSIENTLEKMGGR